MATCALQTEAGGGYSARREVVIGARGVGSGR